MKLSIPKSVLQRGLGRIQAIVEKRGSMPILANTLLEASAPAKGAKKDDSGQLTIAATDLEVGIRGVYDAQIDDPGSITVAARKLFEIIRELPEDNVVLSATPNSYLEIQCARSRFTLAGTAAEEFPSLPDLSPGSMSRLQAAVLSTMIERTMYAASTDETRYNLNGVYFEVVEGGLKIRMVATDGHRLALVDRAIGDQTAGLASGIILPRKALAELKRLVDEDDADEIEIGFEGNNALARKGEVTLMMRLIEGEFPNYQQVLPSGLTTKIVIPADDFAKALRRVVLLSVERSRAVRFELTQGQLRLSSSNPDLGEATEELDVDFDGDDIAIGFNARYVLDCLGAFHTKEVEISLKDDLSAVQLRSTEDPETTAVVMPMRL